MKKMLAMLLAVLTLCFGAAAMAESVPEADAAAEQAALTDLTAEGQLIEAESFQFYIPADWETVELDPFGHIALKGAIKVDAFHHRHSLLCCFPPAFEPPAEFYLLSSGRVWAMRRIWL